ncbi:SRPBCC family protein [Ornithinimicrobium sediminis]|uniref:SRPBCC family protein n=1 Tax=Ornithinimicrobium sediminis TaxID=2904603 RepID=UPI001E481119|nr:SRPBCC family protein [Ornithinimicrobium sediminis]MCE0485730.1 polyketide cyclase [Ornithinimicrobium sediminis]
MNDQSSMTVERTIDASTAEIFEVLSNPERHVELDGSGFVRSVEHADRITATGQVFTMNMEGDHMGGEYKTDNHVVGYSEGALLAWKTAPAGTEPPGWQWVWELSSTGPESTEVRLTYDWGNVSDPELLSKLSFPLVKKEDLEETLNRLAAAVAS